MSFFFLNEGHESSLEDLLASSKLLAEYPYYSMDTKNYITPVCQVVRIGITPHPRLCLCALSIARRSSVVFFFILEKFQGGGICLLVYLFSVFVRYFFREAEVEVRRSR